MHPRTDGQLDAVTELQKTLKVRLAVRSQGLRSHLIRLLKTVSTSRSGRDDAPACKHRRLQNN